MFTNSINFWKTKNVFMTFNLVSVKDTTLIEITENICKALNNNKLACGVFIHLHCKQRV